MMFNFVAAYFAAISFFFEDQALFVDSIFVSANEDFFSLFSINIVEFLALE